MEREEAISRMTGLFNSLANAKEQGWAEYNLDRGDIEVILIALEIAAEL